MKRLALSAALLAQIAAFPAWAEVKVPSIFADHMCFQREAACAVWGWADAGEEVTVSFAGQEKKAKADGEGRWQVTLDGMAASAEGREMTIAGAGNAIAVKDVLVGEVWVCSGQSNMQWSVGQVKDADLEIKAADHPGIRLFTINRQTATEPQEDCQGSWAVCSPDSVPGFTAVGYHFGKQLHDILGVPVALINTSWGGTRSEAWTSREALEAEPAAAPVLKPWDEALANYDPAKDKERYAKQSAAYKEARAAGKNVRPPAPAAPPNTYRHCPAAIYNQMIAPITDYAIKGAIWYQGESNQDRAVQYRAIFPAMIKDWRAQWGAGHSGVPGEFPFYFVQLANYKAPTPEAGANDPWVELQEAQLLTLALANTGMAVINDIGEERDIHPKNKQDVGRRLARWALANDYKVPDITVCGPLFREAKFEGGKVVVSFDHADGLAARDKGPLRYFEVAGEDKVWHFAEAKVQGKTVVATCPDVPAPVAVRYAWAANPVGANLVNRAGLPASCFRSDDWPRATAERTEPNVGN